ncbi:DinB family protein [Segeticoccus rhizosphaerae]|uniref:DinB family protein n=1 Tax=Segeticoccus rhizosphaerae TaxID=1104777 RepID=UPI0012655BE9|nr:DinB family protein [Segeticoccus rhizosphaerae]
MPPSEMWTDQQHDPRENGVVPRGEQEVVLDYLRRYRLTFEMKCEGLDAEQLTRQSVPPSDLSLLGLLRHLARVEHHWYRRVLEGQDLPRLHHGEEGETSFSGAVAEPAVVEEAWREWRAEVDHAREVEARLDSWGDTVRVHGDDVEVRDILIHLVEEYARHCGHADLLRECIDGRTGQ